MSENENQYVNIPVEVEELASEEVKKLTSKLMQVVSETVKDLVWQVADAYIHDYLENDILQNYRDTVRQEIARASHIWSRTKDDYYGSNIRAKIYEEHKEELIPLIQCEEIKRLKKELEDTIKLRDYFAFCCRKH
jgi:hypothetical protein